MDVNAETHAVIARIVERLTRAAEFEDQRADEEWLGGYPRKALYHQGRAAGIRYALAEVGLYLDSGEAERGEGQGG